MSGELEITSLQRESAGDGDGCGLSADYWSGAGYGRIEIVKPDDGSGTVSIRGADRNAVRLTTDLDGQIKDVFINGVWISGL